MTDFRYITLDDCIKNALNEMGMDQRDYARAMPIAKRGWKRIFREQLPDKKTLALTFTKNIQVIDFPIDYDYYTKVGMGVRQNGKTVFMTLSRNDNMVPFTDDDIKQAECSCEATTTVTDTLASLLEGQMPFSYYSVFHNLWRGGQYVGEVYAAGGGESSYGSFQVDEYNSRFSFSTDVPLTATILLEYKPIATARGKDMRIPDVVQEYLIAWIKWKLSNSKNSNAGERREWERICKEEYTTVNEIVNTPTIDEIYDAIYESSHFIKY